MTRSEEDYIKAIYHLSEVSQETIATTAIASQIHTKPSSVTDMSKKLASKGLVNYIKYQGVSLTDLGVKTALSIIRKHRLWEVFLVKKLDFSWDEVHEDAEQLEHAVSPRFMERLATFLDHPTHDPHGDPIPCPDGNMPDTPNMPLAEAEIGQTFVVARLMTQASDVLSYLAKLDIQPSTELKIIDIEPLGGLVHLLINDTPIVLSKELAMLVRGGLKVSD